VIEIRKLAAVDMVFLGPRIVLWEYALGVLGPAALGVLSLVVGLRHQSWGQAAAGLWLLAIGANYVPLLGHARTLLRKGEFEAVGRPELARARRYGTQQVMILVPLLVVILSLLQERRRAMEG
jgi:hypothetical protein